MLRMTYRRARGSSKIHIYEEAQSPKLDDEAFSDVTPVGRTLQAISTKIRINPPPGDRTLGAGHVAASSKFHASGHRGW